MMNVTRGARGEVVIRVDGTLDSKAALRVSERLGEVPVGTEVTLDFTGARNLQDIGLATLAASLSGHGALHVLGLSYHQRRLLRYLGLELEPEEPAHVGDDEAFG